MRAEIDADSIRVYVEGLEERVADLQAQVKDLEQERARHECPECERPCCR